MSVMGSPFGVAFRERRLSLDIKMHEAATALGVDISTISMWETGATGPKLERVADVAQFMDVPVHELLRILAVRAGDLAKVREERKAREAARKEADRSARKARRTRAA